MMISAILRNKCKMPNPYLEQVVTMDDESVGEVPEDSVNCGGPSLNFMLFLLCVEVLAEVVVISYICQLYVRDMEIKHIYSW